MPGQLVRSREAKVEEGQDGTARVIHDSYAVDRFPCPPFQGIKHHFHEKLKKKEK